MIVSKLDVDYPIYGYPKAIEKALAYLTSHDFTKWEGGRYEIDGDLMYANVDIVSTKSYEETKIEGHNNYIDVQYIVDGTEHMGVLHHNPKYPPVESYPERDAYYYDPALQDECMLHMKAGDFAVFYPSDLHRTLIAPEEPQTIRKVIVKVHTSLLRK